MAARPQAIAPLPAIGEAFVFGAHLLVHGGGPPKRLTDQSIYDGVTAVEYGLQGPGTFQKRPDRSGAPRVPLHKRRATLRRRTPKMRQPEGREVVIVEAVRTPIGRGHKEKGYYKDTHPNALLGKSYTEVIARAGIDPAEVEDVIAGCVQQFGEQGFNIARNAWLQEGLPIETPGTTVDRQCGSAQQAVNFSAALIAAGVHDAMIGSGVEHMGHLPFAAGMKTQEEFGYAFTPELMAKHNIVGQGLGAEMIADQWEIPAPSSTSWPCARTGSPTRPPRRAASSARSCR